MPFPSDPPRKPASGIPEADELFRNANPNPERVGCPPREVLEELALHDRAIDDPWFDHLAQCSPCYDEFQALRAEAERRVFARRMWIAAATVALIAFCGWWLFRWTRTVEPERREARDDAPLQVVEATLDLRGYSPLRGEGQVPGQVALRIPRGTKRLRVLLPVGAEPGAYEIELRAGDGRAPVNATGEASIVDFVTTLDADVDLGTLAAGSYRLALRHEQESWREYAVVVE